MHGAAGVLAALSDILIDKGVDEILALGNFSHNSRPLLVWFIDSHIINHRVSFCNKNSRFFLGKLLIGM
jgi:hypothetical protein